MKKWKITIEFEMEAEDPQTDESLMVVLGEVSVYYPGYKCTTKEKGQ